MIKLYKFNFVISERREGLAQEDPVLMGEMPEAEAMERVSSIHRENGGSLGSCSYVIVRGDESLYTIDDVHGTSSYVWAWCRTDELDW